MAAVPGAETALLVDAPVARAAAAPAVPAGRWRRRARRAASLGLFFALWHVATESNLAFYVRFQNIPTPAEVLAEAADLFGTAGFYVHILASLERIWLGFAIAGALAIGLGLLIGGFRLAQGPLFPP